MQQYIRFESICCKYLLFSSILNKSNMIVISLLSQIVWDYLHKLNSNYVASFKERNVLPSRLPQVKRKKINTKKQFYSFAGILVALKMLAYYKTSCALLLNLSKASITLLPFYKFQKSVCFFSLHIMKDKLVSE